MSSDLPFSSDLRTLPCQSTGSEACFAAIVRTSMEAIVSIDEDQKIVLFNPTAEALFGIAAADAIGRPLDILLPGRFREAHTAHVKRFGVTGVSDRQMGLQRTLYALRRDGSEFPIEASISQTDDSHGRKLFTVMLRDITERVSAETALRRSREELQALSDSILASREEEKRRVARELHDDIGQRLSALKMDLAMLEEDLQQEGTPVRSLAQAAAMHEGIDAAIAAVRQISSDLRPPLLDELGLAAALDWLAKDFSIRYGLRIEVRTAEALAVTEQEATAVFRIVQEALNNVVHHAEANRVWIEFHEQEGQRMLRVRDNGNGWDGRARDDTRRSFGLIGIRERARLLSGTLTLTHAPSEGFELFLCFPTRTVERR
ncbi:PAS domain-containing sensor histidine kinase [Cupriavidus pauculus]|uniref:PAS domain-containing sensor histidine kinase n=1 Tax=Cupriavidus pauculus TaxID=82633 RepID=UPI0007815E56|nr:PAS domain-containing sensor histidine kinase [Cupriavidus pauculus]